MLKGTSWGLAAQAVISVGQFTYAGFTSRIFPASVFGGFAAALALQGILALLTTTGLPALAISAQSIDIAMRRQLRLLALAGGGLACVIYASLCHPWLRLLDAAGGGQFIPLLAGNQFLAPIAALESAMLRRRKEPVADALSYVAAFLMSSGATLIWAHHSDDPQALALAPLLNSILLLTLSSFFSRWSVNRGGPERSVATVAPTLRSIGRFSTQVSLQNLSFLALSQLPAWCLSARLGADALGQYSRANTLTYMPSNALSTALIRSFQPHWREWGEPDQARHTSARILILVSTLTFIFFTFVAGLGPALCLLWLGPGWQGTQGLVPILAVAYALYVPFSVTANSLEIRRHFALVRRVQWIMFPALLVGMIAFFLADKPQLAAYAVLLLYFVALVAIIYWGSSVDGYKPQTVYWDLLRTGGACICMFAAMRLGTSLGARVAGHSHFSIFVVLSAGAAFGAATLFLLARWLPGMQLLARRQWAGSAILGKFLGISGDVGGR